MSFLKSSPKITLFPKPTRNASTHTRNPSRTYATDVDIRSLPQSRVASPLARVDSPFHRPPSPAAASRASATWVCSICSFSNPVPSSFDLETASALTSIAPCQACGIKPPWTDVLKAAISNASARELSFTHDASNQQELIEPAVADRDHIDSLQQSRLPAVPSSTLRCPRCTFLNHPSLPFCELCGAPLPSVNTYETERPGSQAVRPESPGPLLNGNTFAIGDASENIKFSFRGGGEKIFYERLKGAMIQRKWLLHAAPPIPRPIASPNNGLNASLGLNHSKLLQGPEEVRKTVGIAGLERRGLELRRNNETVISNAFEDLEGLMASAKEIVALAESFAKQPIDGSSEASDLVSQSATALGMITTKDMLASGSSSESLYLSELSRNLAEYLTDDSRGILRREGGIMSLIDLWAVFNRARGGVELISPSDFERSARLWEKLNLPVRLREFKSGLLVVQRYDWNDQKTIAQLLAWLKELRSYPPPSEVPWDWAAFGRGVTAQDTAERFGWSVGVAAEELELAEERGVLCREEGIEGLRFWENWIIATDNLDSDSTAT
ncbi:hypothetical protein MMC16_005177 [Acarospora aff. strigata]|nr:hypothetical protein [Acarospora aff. strigata]